MILFADADGATEISDLDSLENSVNEMLNSSRNSAAIAIGSRNIARSAQRKILADGFSTLVKLLCVGGISDTQCGFKIKKKKEKNCSLFCYVCEMTYLCVAE